MCILLISININRKMKIQVFAVLKDYFEKEFEVTGNVKNTSSLITRLSDDNPAATGLLNICRFAVKDEFIDNDFQLKEDDTVCIIPPASGG